MSKDWLLGCPFWEKVPDKLKGGIVEIEGSNVFFETSREIRGNMQLSDTRTRGKKTWQDEKCRWERYWE